MSRKILGLDVRHDSVTAVLIASSLRETQIEGCLRVPVPDTGDRGLDLRSAMEAVRSGMNTDQAYCVASIPADEFSFRNLRVPFTGEKKIDQILPFELEPTVPFPLENLVIDFQPILQAELSGATDLIAVAARKTTLETYLGAFAGAGLDPQVIRPGGYATALCLNRFASPPENWILVDIGPHRDTLFFIASGQIRLIRSFPSFRSKNGGSGIEDKIRQTLLSFGNLSPAPMAPEKAFITGRGVNGGGEELIRTLEAALALPVSRADLLRHAGGKIRIASARDWKPDEMDDALALAVAQIEGKSHLNLRRGPFACRRNWAAYRGHLIRLGVFSAILVGLLGLDIFMDIRGLNRRIDRIDREITTIFRSTFPEIQRVVDPVHQMKVAMDELRSQTFLPGDSSARILTITILDEISKEIPAEVDVEFTRMVINPEDILISGNTANFNSVDDIQTHLEKIPIFEKVTINSTNKDQNENRVQFKMKVDL